jgi:hypothetical protein
MLKLRNADLQFSRAVKRYSTYDIFADRERKAVGGEDRPEPDAG